MSVVEWLGGVLVYSEVGHWVCWPLEPLGRGSRFGLRTATVCAGFGAAWPELQCMLRPAAACMGFVDLGESLLHKPRAAATCVGFVDL